jgi:hypothetical protein
MVSPKNDKEKTMPQWGFNGESTQTATGANTEAGRVKGFQPTFAAGDATEFAEKRNTIITQYGWVRRENRSMPGSVNRQLDQIIVAAHPSNGLYYNSNNYTGNPDICQIYVKLNANGYISANATNANLYVVFNAPINFKASGNLCSITVANTSAGNNAVARFANTLGQGRIVNANNTLVFRLPKLQAGTAGSGRNTATYKINAQSISVTGNPLYDPEVGVYRAANLVITGASANNLLDGVGNRITSFNVRVNG